MLPNDLAERLTPDEFAELIAWYQLQAEKQEEARLEAELRARTEQMRTIRR